MKKSIPIGTIFNGTHGKMRLIEDFLPRPEDLVLKEPTAKKVTIVLDNFTINFFKDKAQEFGSSYQTMMRKLLLSYAEKHSKTTTSQ